MSKATKFIVLGAGLVGIIAFFLPLIAVKDSGVEGKLSAFQIVKGIDSVQEVVAAEGGALAGTESERELVADANKALGAVKAIVMALFVPALFLLLFGAIGTARKRFGRGLGIPSLLFGLLGVGIWAILNSAASEAGSGESVAGIGMHLLLVVGLGGVVGGLMATIKPDRPSVVLAGGHRSIE